LERVAEIVDKESRKDVVVTAILAAIWFGAVAIIVSTRNDIPLYLLGIGTLFFLMLVPSMKEIVRNVDVFNDKKSRDERPPDKR
jgi:hypothetical protein